MYINNIMTTEQPEKLEETIIDDKFKVICIGDPHFKIGNQIDTDEMEEKIIQAISDLKPNLIVCLGDILDRHELINVFPLSRATNFLHNLSKLTQLVILIGNHDRPNNSDFLSENHPFNALKLWPNTTVVDKTVVLEIHGHNFVFVPYVSPGKFNDALKTHPLLINQDFLNENKSETVEEQMNITAIFAHQEFKGAKMGAIISEIGDIHKLSSPLVISGHIHDFDELQPNLFYTGTPLQHAYGDSDDKTISLFSFDKKDYKHFEHRRISLGLKKKKIVYLTPAQIESYVPSTKHNVKIVIKGTQEELTNIGKIRNFKELTKMGIKISTKVVESTDVSSGEEFEVGSKRMKYFERLKLEIDNSVNREGLMNALNNLFL